MNSIALKGLILKLLAVPLVGACSAASAAAINTGLEVIFLPLGILVSPLHKLDRLVNGSDDEARKSAEKEAEKIFAASHPPIATTGVYTGALDLRHALKGMLIDSRLPFVEIDAAHAGWLRPWVGSDQALSALKADKKFLRLAFGKEGDPRCGPWQGHYRYELGLDAPPVRPGTCLTAVPSDDLQSSVALGVDASRASKRRLEWVVVDLTQGTRIFSIPFWERQIAGEPLKIWPMYRSAREASPFSRVVEKLLPQTEPTDPAGLPFVMRQIPDSFWDRSGPRRLEVAGEVRVPVLEWPRWVPGEPPGGWPRLYARAIEDGKPVIGNGLLVVPEKDAVGKACAHRSGITRCFVSGDRVFTEETEWAKGTQKVGLHGRFLDGEAFWNLSIELATLPPSLLQCADPALRCSFGTRAITVTSKELVLQGIVGIAGPYQEWNRQEYELVVPLVQLPTIPMRPSGEDTHQKGSEQGAHAPAQDAPT